MDAADQAQVDLHHVGLERGQQLEARVGGAEVVDGRGEAVALEGAEGVGQAVQVAHALALGDLEHQLAHGELAALGGSHGGAEALGLPRDVVGHDVEAEARLHAQARGDLDGLDAAGFVEGEAVDRIDAPEHLGGAFAREAAHQRLVRIDLVPAQVHDGLERHGEPRGEASRRGISMYFGDHVGWTSRARLQWRWMATPKSVNVNGSIHRTHPPSDKRSRPMKTSDLGPAQAVDRNHS
ncbi:hypothetical protein FQZ97_865470 [compost metagenome]